MKVREIIRLLEQDGWYLKATKGSHRPVQASKQGGTSDLARSSKRRSRAWYTEQHNEASRIEAMNYVVVYEKTGTGWSAYVPDLSGVVTTGRTKEEVQRLIREAIAFHLEGLRQDAVQIPEPSASAEVVHVS